MAKATPKDTAAGTDVAEVSDDALELHKENVRDITKDFAGIDFVPDTWDQVADAMGEIIEFQGSPYKVIDKNELIGVPFMIVDVRFSWSESYDNPFVNVLALTKDNEKVVINDGSTGIMEQVKYMVQTTKRKAGIMCPNGLRKSEYKVTVHDGMNDTDKEIAASTYYIA